MDEEYIFIIVTSDSCGHCKVFLDNHYAGLLDKLKILNKVTILHGEFHSSTQNLEYSLVSGGPKGSIKSPLPPKYKMNIGLRSLIGWFPQFFLIRKATWNSDWSKAKSLDIKIINGDLIYDDTKKMLKTEPRRDPSTSTPHTADGIYSWIIKNVTDKSEGTHADILASRGHSHVQVDTAPTFNYRNTSVQPEY